MDKSYRLARECAKFDEIQMKFKEIRFLDALNGFQQRRKDLVFKSERNRSMRK